MVKLMLRIMIGLELCLNGVVKWRGNSKMSRKKFQKQILFTSLNLGEIRSFNRYSRGAFNSTIQAEPSIPILMPNFQFHYSRGVFLISLFTRSFQTHCSSSRKIGPDLSQIRAPAFGLF